VTVANADSAQLNVKVLVRNVTGTEAKAEIRATVVLDPDGAKVAMLMAHVQTDVYVDGKLVDEVTQPVGFRRLTFDWNGGKVTGQWQADPSSGRQHSPGN
jgi:hypothetical protein